MAKSSRFTGRRPLWVWIIVLFYGFSGVTALLSLLGLFTAPPDLAGEELTALKRAALTWSLGGLLPAANLVGSFLLFQMHRYAFYVFVGVFLVNLGNMTGHFLFAGAAAQLNSGSGLAGVVIGMAVSLVVCGYLLQLKKTGVLR